jgi:uncharacterized protein (TIGR03086 family)
VYSDLVSSFTRAAEQVEPLIAAVGADDYQRPTPCPDLDVEHLTAHLIGGLSGFAGVAEGEPLRFDTDPDLTTSDPLREFHTAADRVIAGFSAPGMLERTFTMPWGISTGAQLLGFELLEVVVHGWDIAASLGRHAQFEAVLVEGALAGARQWVDDSTRIPQLFGPEIPVPAGAPAIDRLVGFLGRSPAWTTPRRDEA